MLEIPLSGIKKIEEIAKSSDEYISLSQGSIKLGGIPNQIKRHVQELMNTDTTDYYESCWGIKPLREKLATTLSMCYNTNIPFSQIIPTHGCIGGLALLFLSIVGPDDDVIIPEPAYPAYGLLTKTCRANARFVSCFEQDATTPEGYRWAINVEKIKAATTPKTKIIIFSNPWNPLGIIVPLSVIIELEQWCQEKGIYLIVDEAYRDYTFTQGYQSVLPLINQSDRIICANTFSKNMAMSGWRIGYLVVPEHLTRVLAGMQDVLLNCLNNTAQYAAMFALDHPELTQTFHEQLRSNYDLTVSLLQPLVENGIFTFTKPDGGFYLFLKTQHADATDLCMSLLNGPKVTLVPGSAFGPSGAPFMRLCFAREPQVLGEGLNRIKNYLL
ncbi:MAG: pyridoxal phosphate-dependent aminotransferase [Candidatus Babeliales bacterium]